MAANIIEISENFVIPETQDSPAVGLKASSPRIIIRDIMRKPVLRAVNFDNKSVGRALLAKRYG
ncbi:hypothetical protein FHX15_002624 [Rhizobium sp. BK650]|nr:hypothetical protein [Rhizobium sp. BK650]